MVSLRSFSCLASGTRLFCRKLRRRILMMLLLVCVSWCSLWLMLSLLLFSLVSHASSVSPSFAKILGESNRLLKSARVERLSLWNSSVELGDLVRRDLYVCLLQDSRSVLQYSGHYWACCWRLLAQRMLPVSAFGVWLIVSKSVERCTPRMDSRWIGCKGYRFLMEAEME